MPNLLTKSRAFTLLELLIVLLIIGILIAIGLYRYQTVQESGYDTDAKTSLRAAMINAEAIRSSTGDETYATGVNPSAVDDLVSKLNAKGDGITFIAWSDDEPAVTGDAQTHVDTSSKHVLVSLQPGNSLAIFCNKSKSGSGFCLGTSSGDLATYNVSSNGFTSASGSTISKAYCSLKMPTDIQRPRGCDGTPGSTNGPNDPDNDGGIGDGLPGGNGWVNNNGSGANTPASSGDIMVYAKYNMATSVYNIYKFDTGTNVETALTNSSTVSSSTPVLSADRTKIAFRKYDPDNGCYNELRVMDLSGNQGTPLDCGVENITLSPDGTKIGYKKYVSGDYHLMTVDTDGQTAPSFVLNTGNQFGTGALWSPTDDNLIAYGKYPYNVYTNNLGGSNETQITTSGDGLNNYLRASFSPDGEYLFTTDGSTYGNNALNGVIYRFKLSDQSLNTISTNGQMSEYSWSISPDGTKIAYANDNNNQIYVAATDSQTPPQAVTDTSMSVYSPTWSADGDTLFFSCYSTASQICKASATGSSNAPEVIHTDNNADNYVGEKLQLFGSHSSNW